ncbi:MAG: hypothetical protein CO012_04140 [Syntrophobacterales bacterium CG_4_8_14_3_um_filter_49_14]|nr:MAG: hypothetical protein CO171_04140 [Syntrophobacterales bacterium CG_4_9_14_3_um_filter_49_8]PJC75135.1 MAG: hypothetical protein CO012_04140 [Syntrophobacterales bacterium CG_4_8_14_3_um_filter_49_14]
MDFDVFKEIILRRKTENVTPNDVLRELFGLDPKREGHVSDSSEEVPWVTKGVTFPNGTEFRATHKGKMFNGTVQSGALVVSGTRFLSPSAAAVSITGNSVNGWIFWECKIPGQDGWRLIKNLRKKRSL